MSKQSRDVRSGDVIFSNRNYAVRADFINTHPNFSSRSFLQTASCHWAWREGHGASSSVAMRLSHIWHELCSFTTERSITFVDWRLVRERARARASREGFVFSASPNPRPPSSRGLARRPNARVGRDTEAAR